MKTPPETNPRRLTPYWLSADAAALRAEAVMHRDSGSDDNLDPADADWALVIDLPLELLIPQIDDDAHFESWQAWFDDELGIFDEENPDRAEHYRSMVAGRMIDDPIVITIEPDRIQIWDGWHRTASRIVRKDATIPAIVGTLRGGPPLLDLLRAKAESPM